MSNRKRNTAKPAWLQPVAKTTEERIFGTESPTPKAFVRDAEDNTELDFGIDYQAVADSVVQKAIAATENEKKKGFLRSLDYFSRLQFEMKVTAYTGKIQQYAEKHGQTLSINEMLDEAESLAAQSIFLQQQYGLTLGTLKMKEVLSKRFSDTTNDELFL